MNTAKAMKAMKAKMVWKIAKGKGARSDVLRSWKEKAVNDLKKYDLIQSTHRTKIISNVKHRSRQKAHAHITHWTAV